MMTEDNGDRLLRSVALQSAESIRIARRRAERQAEATLREQADLLNLTHDTIFVRDMDNVITYWNRGAEELYGWTNEEAIGQASHQLMKTIFPAPIEKINEELLGTGRWEGELIHTKRDGTQVVVASRWSLQRDEHGKPRAILETNNDITERKRAEEELRESESRYRHIFHGASVSIWEEDFSQVKAAIDGLKAQGVRDLREYIAAHPEFLRQAIAMVKVVDVNDATVRLFGAASKDELLVSLARIFLPETEQVFAEELLALSEGRTSLQAETVVRTLQGEKLSVLFTIAFPTPLARLNGALVSMLDITDRKRAEYLTQQVFESAPDGVAVVGRDYRYQRVNPVYERHCMMPAERIVGMHVADVVGIDVFEQTTKPNLDRCFAGEHVRYAEWFTNPLGRFYLSVSYAPLRLGSERVEAALVITRDLTEHMLASEALREAQAALARVNRVTTLGVLAASIAHEVNQPLGAIVTSAASCSRWLAAQPPDFEKARRALERIAKDGKRASEVIDRIRTLVKRQAPRKDRIDINEAILEVIALTRDEVRRNEISLETSLAEDLPLVEADRTQLQQVILNLIVNAIEAMSTIGERRRELAIASAKDGATAVRVEVRDSGTGVDPDGAHQLFEAFYTTKADGIGMGLSISRSIIEAHGGRLWVTPNVPHGAVFQFSLPVEQAVL